MYLQREGQSYLRKCQLTLDLLYKDHKGPNCQGSLLSETVEEDLCHWLTACDKRVQIRPHAKSQDDVDGCQMMSNSSRQPNDIGIPQPRIPAMPMA